MIFFSTHLIKSMSNQDRYRACVAQACATTIESGQVLLKVIATALIISLSALSISSCKPKSSGSVSFVEDTQHRPYPLVVGSPEQMLDAVRLADPGTIKFSLLTSSGERLFKRAHQYVNVQGNPDQYDGFKLLTQKSMCSANVAHVVLAQDVTINEGLSEDLDFIPDLIKHLSNNNRGTKLETLQVSETDATKQTEQINTFFEFHTKGYIPIGMVVAGLDTKNDGAASGHVGIVGHIEPGDIEDILMIYHNNWLRPGSTPQKQPHFETVYKGILRHPYMISARNMYFHGHLRTWMPTPWLKLNKETGKVIGPANPTAERINDLNLYNTDYEFTFVLPGTMAQEIEDGTSTHKTMASWSDLKLEPYNSSDKDTITCQTKNTLIDIANNDNYSSLNLANHEIFKGEKDWVNKRVKKLVEFFPRDHENVGSTEVHRAKILIQAPHDTQHFWGSIYGEGNGAAAADILIPKDEAICLTVGQWHQCYVNTSITNAQKCFTDVTHRE